LPWTFQDPGKYSAAHSRQVYIELVVDALLNCLST
jgi:hypothetical protein